MISTWPPTHLRSPRGPANYQAGQRSSCRTRWQGPWLSIPSLPCLWFAGQLTIVDLSTLTGCSWKETRCPSVLRRLHHAGRQGCPRPSNRQTLHRTDQTCSGSTASTGNCHTSLYKGCLGLVENGAIKPELNAIQPGQMIKRGAYTDTIFCVDPRQS